MKTLLIVILLFILFIPSILFAQAWQEARMGLAVVGGQAAAAGAGPPSPDWSTSFEGTAACDTIFTNVYGTTDCDDTGHPSDGTQDIKCTSGAPSGGRYNFGANKDEVWWSASVYMDVADLGTTARKLIFIIDTDGNSPADWGTINSTGLKWNVLIKGASTASSSLPIGQTLYYLRGYAKRSTTVGIVNFAISTDGTSFTTVVNATSKNTDFGFYYRYFNVGRNEGSNLPEDWYFDNVKVWFTDPGWSW